MNPCKKRIRLPNYKKITRKDVEAFLRAGELRRLERVFNGKYDLKEGKV